MTQPRSQKLYRCRYCGVILPAWLPVPPVPDGAMLLYHLSHQHPAQVGPYLDRTHTEDIGTVAAQAFDLIEDTQREDDERRAI
jgi:hypothetical protein